MRIAPMVRAPINVVMIAPHERRDTIPASYQRSSYSRRARNWMRWTLPARCARAADGHVAAPPSSVMNSRRLLLTWVRLLRQSATTKPAH